MNSANLLKFSIFSLILLFGCNPDGNDNNGGSNTASKVWDVDAQCGAIVNTDAFFGPAAYLVWVKNSSESECNVSVKEQGRNIGQGQHSGRIYHPGTNKVYTRVTVRNANSKLQIFCTGDDEKPCKFDYGVQRL